MKKNVHILRRRSIFMLFFLFFSLASVRAQVAVTVTSGATNVTPNLAATYSSFANLTAALNTITAMTGAVNIQLSGGTEVAPPKGFTIGSTTLNAALTASAGNGGNGGINITGIFVGYNNPSNTNLVGGVGTATAALASPDGILKLVGADYIGLTNISFIDPTTNTTPTTAMEFGVALFKASPTDGCQHNYLDTNFFTMQRLNTTVGSGPMIGEAAIIIVNSIPTAAITSITPTSNSGASTDNYIIGNYINGGANGISLYGYFAPAPYNFVDTRNTILTNNIINFGGGVPATSSNGIVTRGQWETDIEYNNIDNNDGFGVNQNSNLYGINVFNATNSNSITSNNVIKLQSGTTTGGQVYGIYNSINTGGNVPGFSTTINNNTIDMAQPLLTTFGNMRGIFCISSSQFLTISNNVISGLSPFAFTGNAYGIYTQGTATTTTITNNSIKNFNRTGTTGITYGILCQGTAATTTATTGPTNVVATGNTIDNLTFTATDNTGSVYGINAGVNTITNTINNNVVKNLAIGTSGSIYGIYDNGIAGTKVCQNNQVFNFSTPAGVGTSTYNSYYGIYYTNNAIAPLNLDISGNSIYSLNNLGTGTNGDVYGIYCTALQPSSIYNNKIYNLSYAGTNTTVNGWVSGIFALNNVSTIYNNTIADLRMPNYAQPAQKLFGIRVGNANLYYNTVFLSGTNASSAAVFSYTTGSLNLNNNIFINTVTPNSGGIATAYSRADTTINTYTASSNYNLFAGTNIYYDGTSTDATLAAYKTRMATRDQNSVTETTTPFISTVGSNPDFLRLPLNAISVANNNALPITSPAITTDYWGVTRSGTTPDIGASEFIGLVCITPTVYTVTGGGNGCGSTGVLVGLSNSQTGVNYQLKLNGVATGGLVAGTGAALSLGNQTVAGTYTVDATSNVVGCTTPIAMSGNAIVTTSPAVNATSSQTNVSCNGGSNGTATVVASGGTAPFTYLWSPTGGTSATTTGRPVGAYTCTITDAVGCSTSKIFTITQPPAISTASWSQTNIACNGGSNGSASVSPSGGTAPYTYSWSNGSTTQSITGLLAGIYTVTVTDANNCTSSRGFTLTQPSALTTTGSQINLACFGGANGSASVSPSGGTSPYTYLWSTGSTSNNIFGLSANTYSVTITDANGCTATRSFTLTQPASAVSGSGVSTNVVCSGGANGAINLTPSGGTPGYTFNWGGGITTEDRTGLAAGTYTVIITDANSCTATRSFTLTQPAPLSGSTVVTNAVCFGASNGTINLTPSGGTAPYTFNWGGGITSEDRTGLAAGSYNVTITDANGCTYTVNGITITQPASTITGTTVVTNVSCNSGSNGAINLTPAGGVAPYTFNWGGGVTTEDRTGLSAGTYAVTITDANGCTGTVTGISITQPTLLSGNATISNNVFCNGGSTGYIILFPSGGTMPYTYNWGGGITTKDRFGVPAGTYAVTITDNNGCTKVISGITVTEPATALSGASTITNVSCNGSTNGAIIITPAGGTAPYTYNWNDSVTTKDRTGLAAGSYSVSIRDYNGCFFTVNCTVTAPLLVSATDVVTNVSCFNGSNGAINLTPVGGTSPYTFNWGDGITTEDRTGLTVGTYSVTITDANGCSTIRSFTVTQPPALVTSLVSQTNISCFGGNNGSATISVSGGTAGYSYNWTPGNPPGDGTATITGVTAATWTCTITDANGCTTSRNVTITQPWALDAIASTQTNVSCNGDNNGSALVGVANGVAPYSYNWNPGNPTGDGTTNATGLTAGTWTCTVTDANGCVKIVDFTITEPAALDNTVSQALGVVTANQNGATYQWYECPSNLISGETNQNYTPTVAGDYKVAVTLAGCTITSNCITVNTLGTENFAFNSKLSVYPNPSSDVFSINSDTRGTFVVYDLIGKIIKTETINLGITKLDLSKYPSGIYLMKVTNDSNQNKTMRLIKQ